MKSFAGWLACIAVAWLAYVATSCGSQRSAQSSSVATEIPQISVSVTITPASATVTTFNSKQFTASVSGTTNPSVTWGVNGVVGGNATLGTITPAGMYTAPNAVPSGTSVSVTATSEADITKSASAAISLVSAIAIRLTPGVLAVVTGKTQDFYAWVEGPIDTDLMWTVNQISGGNPSLGTIVTTSRNGRNFLAVYKAPAYPPPSEPVIVSAVSVVDPTAFASASLTVRRDNQIAQSYPIKLGTSGGNLTASGQYGRSIFCCSGTLGALLSRGGNYYILSNNHVLDKADQGNTGDPISQPGLADVDCLPRNTSTVAHLSQAAPLDTSNVDAAMAQIVPGTVDTSGAILDLAGLNQAAPPSATLADPQAALSGGQTVAKVGDTTGLTCSTVTSISTDVSVQYTNSCSGGATHVATFHNQIVVTGASFSTNGDSGSLVVTADTARPLALLFAGNSNSTVGNPIQDVVSALKDPMTSEVPRVVGGGDHAIACPAAAQSNVIAREQVLAASRLSDSEVARATAARNRRAIELMQDPAVTGVEAGQSDDNTNESALVVFLKSQPRVPIPAQIDGVRTKIVMGSELRAQTRPASLPEISDSEVVRARATKEQHADDLMANPAILGVGVGASNDNPSEGATVVFVEQGKSASVPPQIDGVRTRIVITDRFRTFNWGKSTVRACSRK